LTTLDRQGIGIDYSVDSEGTGTPVLFTHGFGDTGRVYGPTIAALHPARPAVSWDIRGHGRSDYPDDQGAYTPAAAVGDMVAIIDGIGAEKVILVGHSMGGFLSLDMQRRHPGRVSGLVLIGTGPGYRSDEPRAGWNAYCESTAGRLEAEGDPSGRHRSADGLIRAARGILPQYDSAVVDHLPDIDVPVLLIVGENDKPFLAGMSYMAKKVPDADHVIIEGAGHTPMESHPDRLAAEISRWLSRVDPVPGDSHSG
jgi:pimeloyl-ACP methyl ester carboxylesterase